ncbi:MAG: hypothetical protein ACE5EO_12610 [Candidatus Krumholzibacteriia bacterium]
MRKFTIVVPIVTLAIALTMAPGLRAGAGKYVMHLTTGDLSKQKAAGESLGDFYILQFEMPSTVRSIRRAYLELFVDASSRTIGGYTNDTPVIEVYALKGPFSGTLDPNQFEAQAVPVLGNVVAGGNKRVVLDITEIAASFLENPAKNHGLVIGSLTEDREGIFSIRNDAFNGQGVARITFLY